MGYGDNVSSLENGKKTKTEQEPQHLMKICLAQRHIPDLDAHQLGKCDQTPTAKHGTA